MTPTGEAFGAETEQTTYVTGAQGEQHRPISAPNHANLPSRVPAMPIRSVADLPTEPLNVNAAASPEPVSTEKAKFPRIVTGPARRCRLMMNAVIRSRMPQAFRPALKTMAATTTE